MDLKDPEDTGLDAVTGPEIIIDDNSDEPIKRGRGRPRKDGQAPGSATVHQLPPRSPGPQLRVSNAKKVRDLGPINDALCVAHLGLATKFGMPELEITPDEAAKITTSVAELLDHYKIKVNEKHAAIFGVIFALGSVYGPKGVMVYAHIQHNKEMADKNAAPVPQAR